MGTRSGHQASDVAGDLGADVHVGCGDFARAISADEKSGVMRLALTHRAMGEITPEHRHHDEQIKICPSSTME
jgi:hypothetical protein